MYILWPCDPVNLIHCLRTGLNLASDISPTDTNLIVSFSNGNLVAQVRCRIRRCHSSILPCFAFNFSLCIDMVPGSTIFSAFRRWKWFRYFDAFNPNVSLSLAGTLQFRSLTIELAPSSLLTFQMDVRPCPAAQILSPVTALIFFLVAGADIWTFDSTTGQLNGKYLPPLGRTTCAECS